MVTLKQGVVIANLDGWDVLDLIVALGKFWEENSLGELFVTSGIEGTHKRNSRHYLGHAIDVRLPPNADDILQKLRATIHNCTIIKEVDHFHFQLGADNHPAVAPAPENTGVVTPVAHSFGAPE